MSMRVAPVTATIMGRPIKGLSVPIIAMIVVVKGTTSVEIATSGIIANGLLLKL